MRHIEQYVSLIIRTISRSIAIDDTVTYTVDSPLAATIEGLVFTRASSLSAQNDRGESYREPEEGVRTKVPSA
jgi:hypothetical protein